MFFTSFNQIASPGVDYHLTISQSSDGRLAVSLLPKVNDLKDPAQHLIGPLSLTGTPEELDHGFFPAVAKPIKKTSGIVLDLKKYEEQQKEAETNSKAAKAAKEEESKEAKEKKSKYDGHMKKAEEMETAGNLDGALIQLQQARLHATDKAAKTVDGKIAEIKKKIGAGTLFGASPAAQPAAVESAPAPVTVPTPAPQPVPAPPATGSQSEVAAPSNEPASGFSPANAENPVNHAAHAPAAAASHATHAGSATVPANGHGAGMFGPADGAVHRMYAGSPQPADSGYPTYRESDYAGYIDFIPPTGGGGMGAPMF
jgi:PRTRC genetic system protein E